MPVCMYASKNKNKNKRNQILGHRNHIGDLAWRQDISQASKFYNRGNLV